MVTHIVSYSVRDQIYCKKIPAFQNLSERYYNLIFFNENLLKGFLLENMQYSSFGSILKEAIKTTKLRVVAGIQDNNP